MSTGSHKPVQLSELAALNDEIVSLVRAKIPLPKGLRRLARDGGGRMFELASQVADSMDRGDSLEQAIEQQPGVPAVWASIVRAGVRSGRLTSALESVSGFAWELIDLRRHIGQALVYPLILICLSYGLFVVFVAEMLRRMDQTYLMLHLERSWGFELLMKVVNTIHIWGWIPPVIFAVLVILWIASRRATTLEFAGIFSPLGWIPGVGRIGRSYSYYSFSHMMSLMCEQGIPLDESLELAADATGSSKIKRAAYKMADVDRRGDVTSLAKTRYSGFPSFLQWIISRDQGRDELIRSLRMSADVYQQRAKNQVLWLRYTFPVFASLFIGGAVTFVYTLSLFLPLADLLGSFANEF